MSSGRQPEDEDLRAWAVEYGPALRRYFLRRANAADVDDLVQEVFLMMQARGSGAEIENIEGYLFRTAANVLGMRRRRSTWAWGRQEDVEDVEGLSDELSPERILLGREALDRMMAELRELPPRCAHAFILYRFEHMPQEAIARHMGISVKAVEALVQRAARRLFDRVGWRP
ncbi:MAG TPA: sigma-70 family RNA polymerase sigma factor [Caulobacteraceae bacterium]